jgi:hypothetical protein
MEELGQALLPTWHEARVAGRVQRHTVILRGLAHVLSTAPDREDRPGTAAEARAAWNKHLAGLEATPRMGLAAATGAFIDSIVTRARRYEHNLFHCFDDPRIPASTNALEQFFGISKRAVRHALGSGSTSNSVVANLGAEPLLALHQLRNQRVMTRAPTRTVAAFRAARQELAELEAPGIHRRSLVRNLDRHLHGLRDRLRGSSAELHA